MIRTAVIGTGPITRRFADAVATVEGITLDAVYSRDAGRGQNAAERLGAARSFTDFRRLLDAPDIDAVYIASPNSVHLGQARDALAAGKHVLVEKPAVRTVGQWRELCTQAEAAGLVLLEAMRTAYDAGTSTLREMLPSIGRLRHATIRHVSRSARYDLVLAGQQVNIFDPAMDGGALRDLGVYCVHAMVSLLGMPDSITAAAVRVASGADGAGAALAKYEGCVVEVEYSKITSSTLPTAFHGEAGTLLLDHIASPRELTLERFDGTTETRTLDAPQHTLTGVVGRFVDAIGAMTSPRRDQVLTEETLAVMEEIESRMWA